MKEKSPRAIKKQIARENNKQPIYTDAVTNKFKGPEKKEKTAIQKRLRNWSKKRKRMIKQGL
jgi:hypothetical protein